MSRSHGRAPPEFSAHVRWCDPNFLYAALPDDQRQANLGSYTGIETVFGPHRVPLL
jgi:hypothetical protein